MAKPKYDGVVDSVRYKPGGGVDWVRAYLRRGATFSDHVLIDREALIQQLKAGKKFVVGQRVPLMASTFDVSQPLKLNRSGEKYVLVVGEDQSELDRLDGVPVV